jgi:hypothetical protein
MANKIRKVSVNIAPNDPVDIKAGGPPYLGFDYYVDAELTPKHLRSAITGILKKNDVQPLCGIYIDRPFVPQEETPRLWTLSEIEENMAKELPWMVNYWEGSRKAKI